MPWDFSSVVRILQTPMGWNRVVLATLAVVFVFTEASGESEADIVTELDPGPCVLDAGPSLQPKELLMLYFNKFT